jgi:hypothetical protein
VNFVEAGLVASGRKIRPGPGSRWRSKVAWLALWRFCELSPEALFFELSRNTWEVEPVEDVLTPLPEKPSREF